MPNTASSLASAWSWWWPPRLAADALECYADANDGVLGACTAARSGILWYDGHGYVEVARKSVHKRVSCGSKRCKGGFGRESYRCS